MRKAHRLTCDSKFPKFLGSHIANDRQVLGRRPKVLAQRKNADAVSTEIAHHLEYLFRRLSQSQHEAGLRRRIRPHPARMLQHLERTLVARAQPYLAV